MRKEIKTKCCNISPIYSKFTYGFGCIGKSLICPKCRSCCGTKTGYNLIK